MRFTKVMLFLTVFSLFFIAVHARTVDIRAKYGNISPAVKKLIEGHENRNKPIVPTKAKEKKAKPKIAPTNKSNYQLGSVKHKIVSVGKDGVRYWARITHYTWTGNHMSNGLFPEVGYVAVSDRSIKLGSIIWIGQKKYIVGDRTAEWVHEKSLKLGYAMTVDIYIEGSNNMAVTLGKTESYVVLEKKTL